MLDFSAIRCSLMQRGAIFQGSSRGIFSEAGVFELPLFLWEPKVTLPGQKTNPFCVWLGGQTGNPQGSQVVVLLVHFIYRDFSSCSPEFRWYCGETTGRIFRTSQWHSWNLKCISNSTLFERKHTLSRPCRLLSIGQVSNLEFVKTCRRQWALPTTP